jgi:hypothetical protein
MDRRDFLKILLATPIAATYDFEQLLWVPKPTIVVPEVKLYKPGSVWLEAYGALFAHIDNKGILRYAENYKDVDTILNSIWREQR